MHLLIGALVGGVLSAAITAVLAMVMRRRITLGMMAGSFLAGALMGGFAASGLGMGVMAGGGAKALATMAATGGATSAVGQVAENAIEGMPLSENVAKGAAFGAVSMPLVYTGIRSATRLFPGGAAHGGHGASRLPDAVRMPLEMPMVMPPMAMDRAAGHQDGGAGHVTTPPATDPSHGAVPTPSTPHVAPPTHPPTGGVVGALDAATPAVHGGHGP